MQQLLRDLKEQFDFVLLDAPPIIPVTDSVVLATMVEAVILVVKGGEWGRDVVRRALAQLDAVQARTVGAILNQVDVTRNRTSAYYYQYYMGYRTYYGGSRGHYGAYGAHEGGESVKADR